VLALALALGASLCWGTSDFVGGLQARRIAVLAVLLVSQGVGLIAISLLVAVRDIDPPALIHLLPAAAAGFGGAFALAGFYWALAIGTMSIVAPISSTGAIVPVVVGIASGGRPAPLQLVGIATAIVGVVLASREHGPGVESPSRASRASIALALLAALGFGGYLIGARATAHYNIAWSLLAAHVTAVAVMTLVVAVMRVSVRGVRGALGPLAAVGLLDLVANGLFATASRHGLLAVVAVGSSLYPLATVVLARVVLGERVRPVQEVGIAAAVAGVVMIAAG
jgi:drug/metabolite transporter (DMT)-like permease